jgi:hypothetical protein
MSYYWNKLASSITESTIWTEPYATRVLWIAMIAMADQYGRVFGSIPGLARRANITLEETEAALYAFQQADPYSRTTDFEGRRIEVIDGGWRLLNHAKYKALKDEHHQAERKAKNQTAYRERLKGKVTEALPVLPGVTESDRALPQIEIETEIEDKSITPSMVVSGVLDDLQLSGMELRVVLEDVCRMAMKAGTSADDLRASLVDVWRDYERAKPKLSYAWGAKAFFGEGHWRNKRGWPWKPGEEPTTSRPIPVKPDFVRPDRTTTMDEIRARLMAEGGAR